MLGILVTIFLAWLILYITKGRFLKHPFERTVAAMTHRQVKVPGDFQLYFDPINIHFVAEGMTISNPAWASKPNLFEAKRIDTRISTFPLIFGDRRVKWLDMLNGAVDLEWSKDGKTNTWTFSEKKGKPFEMPLIRQATVAGTTLRYIDPKLRLSVDLAFKTIKATDTRFASSIQFTGTGTERDTPFTVNGEMSDAECNRCRRQEPAHAAYQCGAHRNRCGGHARRADPDRRRRPESDCARQEHRRSVQHHRRRRARDARATGSIRRSPRPVTNIASPACAAISATAISPAS